MSEPKFHRVTAKNKCPICGHRDWCLISHNEEVAICARTESISRCGESGWLHRLYKGPADKPRVFPKVTQTDEALGRAETTSCAEWLKLLSASFQQNVDRHELFKLAKSLGLSHHSLDFVRIGWTGRAWSFPMSNAKGDVLGIRLRFPDGKKLSVKGGKEGLFIPTTKPALDGTLIVCEGPTDTAAMIDMGFKSVVGRPNCNGGTSMINSLAMTRRIGSCCIVADADEPGLRGAYRLASSLSEACEDVRVIQPPAGLKDAREWLTNGGTSSDVKAAFSTAERVT